MADKCNWIVFQAHTSQYNEKEEAHPDFFGVFVCPGLRRDPEQLLGEVLSNRKLFLVQITGTKLVSPADDWGMNERLKTQIGDQGFGFSLTKIHGTARAD